MVYRLDRASGEYEALISGHGGSVRPTPSPDGSHIAFIRRVRGKTTLFVREIPSGRERLLYDLIRRSTQPFAVARPEGRSLTHLAQCPGIGYPAG